MNPEETKRIWRRVDKMCKSSKQRTRVNETSFSKLRRLQNRLKSFIDDERLGSLL